MENAPSASNDNFHNFLCYDDLPGILIPQKVYLDPKLGQEPKDVRSFVTFYRHKTVGVTVSAMPGASLGVSLAEALNFDREDMRWRNARSEPSLAPLECMSLKFVLKWPGYVTYLSKYTQHGRDSRSIWTAARLAHEVARAVYDFHEAEEFEKRIDRSSPAPDWTSDRIPYDKLYLLELRQVSARVFQPVLCYDAN